MPPKFIFYQLGLMPKIWFLLAKTIIAVSVICAVIVAYLFYHFSNDLPDYSQLKAYHPPCVTRIYSADGKLIEEYAREKRIFVPINNVPHSLVQAFIAAEDKNFYQHAGIDFFSIIRAAIANIFHIMDGSRMEGGSTITQQVVKNFLLTSERSLERKIKEAILSYMISQTLSKDQILELYLNQSFLGKGAYGVAAAALAYFNKSVEELTIAESALLASLLKAPSKYTPEKNYDRALGRRNYVIGRMLEDGYISKNDAEAALKEPITLVKQDKIQTLDADYYAEQVRSEVIGMFGEEYFYSAGLTIITCANSKFQQGAAEALRFGIKAYDTKRGYRGALKNIPLNNWQETIKAIPRPVGLRHYKIAIILNIENTKAKIGLQDGSDAEIKLADMKWTKTNLKSVKDILKTGDVIVVEKSQETYKLQQIPEVNGGIMVVEPQTGRVLAAEGGYDYDISKFDRTTQAKRQPGSLIKPFVYLAAIEHGAKPTDIFEDGYVEIHQGQGLPIWRPKNFDDKFLGSMTLRRGLEKSRNTVTIRVGQVAGLKNIATTFQRFGINDQPSTKVASIVLGALETTLERMTMAYSVFANNGKKVTPHYIELIKDRKGNILYKRDYTECPECRDYKKDKNGNPVPPSIARPTGEDVVDEESSYQITSILEGAIQRGTGQAAKSLPQIIAGKTGTSNDAKDTWFIGYTPEIVVGTYIGYDTPRSLGKKASGATIALPVFIEFMKTSYKGVEPVEFTTPAGIKLVSVDYITGQPSSKYGSIIEALKVPGYQSKIIPKNQAGDGLWEYFNKDEEVIKNNPDSTEQDQYDPFGKIQEEVLPLDEEVDNSDEVY